MMNSISAIRYTPQPQQFGSVRAFLHQALSASNAATATAANVPQASSIGASASNFLAAFGANGRFAGITQHPMVRRVGTIIKYAALAAVVGIGLLVALPFVAKKALISIPKAITFLSNPSSLMAMGNKLAFGWAGIETALGVARSVLGPKMVPTLDHLVYKGRNLVTNFPVVAKNVAAKAVDSNAFNRTLKLLENEEPAATYLRQFGIQGGLAQKAQGHRQVAYNVLANTKNLLSKMAKQDVKPITEEITHTLEAAEEVAQKAV